MNILLYSFPSDLHKHHEDFYVSPVSPTAVLAHTCCPGGRPVIGHTQAHPKPQPKPQPKPEAIAPRRSGELGDGRAARIPGAGRGGTRQGSRVGEIRSGYALES